MTLVYNASTSVGIVNYGRFLTNTNTTTYASGDALASVNRWYQFIISEVLQAMDDWDFQGEYGTANLVASQQEYTLPSDILKIKRVEVTYDGTNWYTASPMDLSERADATDSTSVNNDFNTAEPFYDLMDNSLFLYPIPTANSTGGLKIWYEKEGTELTNTSEPNLPEFAQKALSYGMAMDYFEKYSERDGFTNKRNLMKQELNEIIEKTKEHFNTKHQDRPYRITPVYKEYGYGNRL